MDRDKKMETDRGIPQPESDLVPMEGVEPTHPCEYQILSLARLPIPPHRPPWQEYKSSLLEVNQKADLERR